MLYGIFYYFRKMKSLASFIFILICSLSLLSCSKNDQNTSDNLIRERKDVLLLYNLAKEKKYPIKKSLKILDSAQKIAKKTNDIQSLVKIYSLKNALFSKTNFKDSSLAYAKKMLELSILDKDTVMIGKAYFKFSHYYKKKSKLDSAYYFLFLSKEMYLSQKENSQVGKKLMAMARILTDDGDHYASEKTSIEALNYFTPIIDDKYIASTFLNLSVALQNQNKYDEAIQFINKGLEIAPNHFDKIKLLNSKALTLSFKNEYDKSIKIYSEILRDSSVTKNKKEYARYLDNLAYTKWLSGNTLDVESRLQKALAIRSSINDASGLIASYSHLMKYYLNKNEKKAILYANNLYDLTTNQNNIEDRLEALAFLRKLTPKKNREYSELYIKLKDSVTKAREIANNKYAAIRYNSQKDKEKAQNLEISNNAKALIIQKQKNQNLALALLLVVVCTGIGFVFYYFKQKSKTERIEERHATETRLSKKLHDEVGNDVFHIMSQLQNDVEQKKEAENTNVIKSLNTVYNKVRDFSRNLNIETGSGYKYELSSLFDSYGNQNVKVLTNTSNIDFWDAVSDLKKKELYVILKELLTNMKKHSQATRVTVFFLKEKKYIQVKYTDNGVGMDLQSNIHKNGLLNVENRIKDIKGTVTFESKPQEGFKSIIRFAH